MNWTVAAEVQGIRLNEEMHLVGGEKVLCWISEVRFGSIQER